MNRNSKLIAAGFAIVVLGGLAYTQTKMNGHDPMTGMNHSMTTPANASDSTNSYEAAMASMMKGMMVTPTGKPDLDFVNGMIPHHQGAIDMAKIVLQYGKDGEIRALAEDVIKAQESEISSMKDWLSKADQSTLVAVTDSIKPNEDAMSALMKNMMQPYSGDADVDFVKGMIPHHQGAIDMAKIQILFGKEPSLLKLAKDIVSAQEGEITFMQGWLKKNGN